ncbi:MAG: isopentenyl-diphosphate Delta-isomerase [Hyphomicrobiales bacterium]|jgi:isopentenyl-diphosphate delta-isomerase|nr:isopentenyl-diphosphate Delta-isomerase [Hyphomicrobiales bacterium]
MIEPGEDVLILVSEANRAVGSDGKLAVHQLGLLHRAFSIFLFDEQGRVLLQRRDFGKYHSGGLWANTCCGHPRLGERTLAAAHRRLGEELGMQATLRFGFQARYRTSLDHDLTENELVYVYVGRAAGPITPNPAEVCETRFMPLPELIADTPSNPDAYAYWLRHYLARHADALLRLSVS